MLEHGGDVYSHAGDVLDFSANINPLGLPEGVKRAIIENIDSYVCYPDPLCRELKRAIAGKEGVPEEQIVCGNGAADIIYRIAWAMRPKTGLIVQPTFSEYGQALSMVGARILHCRLREDEDFALGGQALDSVKKGMDVMFVCNPNNPTGRAVRKEIMLELARRCLDMGTLLIVDECFMDFLETSDAYSLAGELGRLPNLIVLKAFTKLYAMAGLRLGYALCGDAAAAKRIAAAGQPWSVSSVASVCGVAALKEDEYVRKTCRLIKANRGQLERGLDALGVRRYPSDANFLLLRCETPDFEERLREGGVLVRSCANFMGLDSAFFRIAVKSEEDNRYLLERMKAAM